MQINKLNNSITSVLDNMHHPHGGKRSDKLCLATSTNSGEVVIVENEKERRYFTANLKGKSAELGEMEWLQNSILWGNFILTIDSNRTAFIVFDPINKLYDMIPYDMDWAIQDIVGGKLKEIQKNILKEISLSI